MNTPLPASVNSSASPSATSIGSTVYVFYKGVVGDSSIWMTENTDLVGQGQWTEADRLPITVRSSDAPSAVAREGVLYVAYKGETNTNIYVIRSEDQASKWEITHFDATVNTSTAPCLFFIGDTLHVFYKGAGSDQRVYMARLPANAQWTFLHGIS